MPNGTREMARLQNRFAQFEYHIYLAIRQEFTVPKLLQICESGCKMVLIAKKKKSVL